MGNVLVIPSNYETTPSNVLVIQPQPQSQPVIVNESTAPYDVEGPTLVWADATCTDLCGFQCTALAHESQTGWWIPFYTNECAGEIDVSAGWNCTTRDICDPCWNGHRTPFTFFAQNAAIAQFLPSDTLGKYFPGWAIEATVYDATTPIDIDGWTIICATYSTETLDYVYTWGPTASPPPPPPSGGHVGYVDPPLPFAPDGIGFSYTPTANWTPLPVHPVLSQARIIETCGTCGGEDTGEELEL